MGSLTGEYGRGNMDTHLLFCLPVGTINKKIKPIELSLRGFIFMSMFQKFLSRVDYVKIVKKKIW